MEQTGFENRFLCHTSIKAGNMFLNRFCIDEESAFETSGVYYLREHRFHGNDHKKGKGLSSLKRILLLIY